MVIRTGRDGEFYGCQRFPLCVGSIPMSKTEQRPWDSYTKLLMEAHANAVHHLARPEMLGRLDCITWWAERPTALSSLKLLEELIDEASAEASARGPARDFIQEAHDRRVAKMRNSVSNSAKYKHVLEVDYLKRLPPPRFTRRWDSSELDQVEAIMSPSRSQLDEDSWQQRRA